MSGRTLISRRAGFVLAWLLAAVAAIAVGVFAVTSVGESIRGRGPLGSNEMIRNAELPEGQASPDPAAAVVPGEVSDVFGTFVVECRGSFAVGVETRPDTAAGWRTISFERGPDDDVDAVFANGKESIEVEVFCNRGQPTVADFERKTLSDGGADEADDEDG